MMEKKFLNQNTYDFYGRFKKYVKENILSEVIIGSKNKKVKLKNGKILNSYHGNQVRELSQRINRNINSDGATDAMYVTIVKNNRIVVQFYKDWDYNRLDAVLKYLEKRGSIREYDITKFKF
jgi:hypothetical protein